MRKCNRGRFAVEALDSRILLSTVYVDNNPEIETHDGQAWDSAFADLQDALAAANSGDDILVADGTYVPTSGSDRTAHFALKTNVGVSGGFAGFGAANPDADNPAKFETVLSGNLGDAEDDTDNSYHVLVADGVGANAVLYGVTVAGGYANGDSGSNLNVGGGILIINSSALKVLACTFTNDFAQAGGGAVCVSDNGTSTIQDSTFIGNAANSFGGAILNRNSATPNVIGDTFITNTAAYGGAMTNDNGAVANTEGCIFKQNSASSDGGAVYNEDSGAAFLNNCFFLGNSAHHGGTLSHYSESDSSFFNVINGVFVGNTATINGGAVVEETSAATTFVNCTFVSNQAPTGGVIAAFIEFDVTNSIFWSNATDQISGEVNLNNSDIQGGYFQGANNVNADPRFVRSPSAGTNGTWGNSDDDYGNLNIKNTSPCIDVGNTGAVSGGIIYDVEGKPRRIDFPGVHDTGAIVDTGAFENQALSSISGTVFNDSNANGINGAGELGFKKVRVFIDKNDDGIYQGGEKSALTDVHGNYTLADLIAGSYHVCEVVPTGWRKTLPAGVFIDVSSLPVVTDLTGQNFGNTQKILISGTVFNDANGNKKKDTGERGFSAWTVYIDANHDGRFQKSEKNVLTNASGNWSFTDLAAGTYIIRIVPKKNYNSTAPSGGVFTLTVAAGGSATAKRFGARHV